MWRVLILAGMLLSVPGWAETTPVAVVKQFFSNKPITDKAMVYTGEMAKQFAKRPNMGQRLPAGIQRSYRLLQNNDGVAVVAVMLKGTSESQDWYVYLVKEARWKLAAMRTLALPSFYYTALKQLADKPNLSEQEQALYQNMRLTVSPDSKLKQYFIDHQKQLEQLVVQVKTDPQGANKAAKALHLNFVKPADGRIDVNIGGLTDNAVGYMYVPDGVSPPLMKADHYIYVEHIQGHWYLYKTT